MRILDLLFPRFCIACKKTWGYLCNDCKKLLIPHPEVCPYCHRFSKNFETCIDCKCEKWNYLSWLMIWFSYKTLLKKLILALKFYHKKDIWDFLASRLKLVIWSNQYFHDKLDKVVISYIPSHRWRRYFVKWYNQSQILAQLLAEKLDIPCLDMMKKTKFTSSQTKLNREKRLQNLNNTFEVDKLDGLEWKSILIFVDDITTTGSTINEAAKTVKQHFPNIEIWWLVVWRHM